MALGEPRRRSNSACRDAGIWTSRCRGPNTHLVEQFVCRELDENLRVPQVPEEADEKPKLRDAPVFADGDDDHLEKGGLPRE